MYLASSSHVNDLIQPALGEVMARAWSGYGDGYWFSCGASGGPVAMT